VATLAATLLLCLAQSGCVGATGAKPINGPALSLSTSTLAFGSAVDSGAAHLVLTMTNPGTAAVSITQIVISSKVFNITGAFSLPINIPAGKSGTLNIQFAPTTVGPVTGTMAITSNASKTPTMVALTGTGVAAQAQMVVSPSSIPFGTVQVGGSAQQAVTVSNPGNMTLSVSQVSLSGTGFSIVGTLPLPISVGPSGVSVFKVQFAPTATGAANGTMTISSNASSTPTVVTMSGTGTSTPGQPQISVTPNPVPFNSVGVGGSSTQVMTISNPGAGNLTVTALSASGTGYSVSGFTLPISVASGHTANFNAKFAPTTAGASSGSITITSNASPAVTSVAMTGTGVQSGITATPPSATFANVIVGSPNSQTFKLQNAGSTGVTITSAAVSGTGFTTTGLSTPLALAGGASSTFNVVFAPTSAGNVSGSVVLTGNMSNSPLTIPLTGSAVSPSALLNPSTTSLTYTNVAVGSNSAQNVILTNNGNSSVTISAVTETGAGFIASGVTAGQVVTSGNTATLTVTFTPTSGSTVTGNVVVASTASNTPINIALTGTGVAQVQHSVALSWTASTSNTVVGYKVYRGTQSGGPYTLITNTPVTGTTFTDTTVVAGQTYFYVVTAVDGGGNESVNSNEVSAVVPTP